MKNTVQMYAIYVIQHDLLPVFRAHLTQFNRNMFYNIISEAYLKE